MRRSLQALLVLSLSLGLLACGDEKDKGGEKGGVEGRTLSKEERFSGIISPPPNVVAVANGDSDNTTFSQDNRQVKLVAYDSEASNLVEGDTNGVRDVLVLTRFGGAGNLKGSLQIASKSNTGELGNGESRLPSLDGDSKNLKPHCVSFESSATNLDPADTTPDWDIYVRDLTTQKTVLASPELPTDAKNSVIDGECHLVSFDSGGVVYIRDLIRNATFRVANGQNPDQQTNGKGVTYERDGQIYYQTILRKELKGAYTKGVSKEQRLKNLKKRPLVKVGVEMLVSAGKNGAGNGVSKNPVIDDNGYYVAFESTATNLCQGLCKGVSTDRNGAVSDVFRRTLPFHAGQIERAPTKDRMQMVSYSYGGGKVNAQGNGGSYNPAISGAGETVLFESESTNLRESDGINAIDPNGSMYRDIYYWYFKRSRMYGNVSREARPGKSPSRRADFFPGNTLRPSGSSRMNYIAFTSDAPGKAGELNGPEILDVFVRFLGGSHEGHKTN